MNLYGAADRIAPIQTRDYPALGFDPAPGGVPTVAEVATNLENVARELGEAYTDLIQIGQSDGIWQGEAAKAFQGKVGELPDYLDKAHRSLSGAAVTLKSWGEDLSTMQQTAAEYERQAAEALRRVQQAEANPNLGLAGQFFADPAELQRAEAALAEAQQQLSNANASLDQIRENAQRLLDQHRDLASQVAEALRRAKDEAPEEPGFLDKLGDALGDMVDGVKDLASDAWQWVQDHADVIAKIGDVLSTIGNVLGVVALATSWIPGVNAVTAAAAIGVSAAAVGTKLLAKAAGADVSWGSIGMDALGVIPGGKVVAGAKNAMVQAGKTSALGAIGRGTNAVRMESKVLSEVSGVAGKVDFTPITKAELRANPQEAIQNAAAYTHAKAVNTLNKVPGVSMDPFSTSGIVAGAAVESGKKIAVGEALDYGRDQAASYVENKTGWDVSR